MEAAIGPRPMADARVGQKTGITRRPASRGTRPSAPKDLRTVLAYIFGAICPVRGMAAGLVMPHCNTEAMTARLAEISRPCRPCRPWRTGRADPRSGRLACLRGAERARQYHLLPPCRQNVPPRIKSGLNPVENIWQFLRDNWLSNTIFATYDDIVQAWNNPKH